MTTERVYTIDRVEGDLVVLVDEDERTVDARVERFQVPLEEGLVLRIPIGDKGLPQWGKAEVDREATLSREAEARERLKRGRRGDPGDDLTL